ncbi:MAG: hypothetical protein AVDCRST_MAG43-425, partial [uncultured Thermomicrobiales bacterium]
AAIELDAKAGWLSHSARADPDSAPAELGTCLRLHPLLGFSHSAGMGAPRGIPAGCLAWLDGAEPSGGSVQPACPAASAPGAL